RTSLPAVLDRFVFSFLLVRRPPIYTLFPYTTLFRSRAWRSRGRAQTRRRSRAASCRRAPCPDRACRSSRRPSLRGSADTGDRTRSEEHTSELQSPYDLVCRLLLEKKHDLLQLRGGVR